MQCFTESVTQHGEAQVHNTRSRYIATSHNNIVQSSIDQSLLRHGYNLVATGFCRIFATELEKIYLGSYPEQ